jgi:hypothetical protein
LIHAKVAYQRIFSSGKSAPTPERDKNKESTQSKPSVPVDPIQLPQLEAGSSKLPSETKEVPKITTLEAPSPAALDSIDQDTSAGRVPAGNERLTSLTDKVIQADTGTVSGTPVVSADDNETIEVNGDTVRRCSVCGIGSVPYLVLFHSLTLTI